MVDEQNEVEKAQDCTEKKRSWRVVLRDGLVKELLAWIIVIVAYWIYCLISE